MWDLVSSLLGKIYKPTEMSNVIRVERLDICTRITNCKKIRFDRTDQFGSFDRG